MMGGDGGVGDGGWERGVQGGNQCMYAVITCFGVFTSAKSPMRVLVQPTELLCD